MLFGHPLADRISQTARGAILIFILLQITYNATNGQIGTGNPFNHYVKFLPDTILIPTFWNEDERQLVEGTSLEAALKSKLESLDHEFTNLREKTASIGWCIKHWWDTETGQIDFDDWKYVDAAYRSRALEVPNIGHAMVPCIDMANHASGKVTAALYEADVDGNVVLLLRNGKAVDANAEVTITYGDKKGACEMLFSYGFLEENTRSAKELFLDIEVPSDDPLRMAKRAASKSPPGFKLFSDIEKVGWEGPFVWLICVNEEDGLEFKIAQSHDGEQELLMFFKSEALKDASAFADILHNDDNWHVFQLRAITMVQGRVEQQLLRLRASDDHVQGIQEHGDVRSEIEGHAMELRDKEESLMLEAYEELEESKNALVKSPVVQQYLGRHLQQGSLPHDEDFS